MREDLVSKLSPKQLAYLRALKQLNAMFNGPFTTEWINHHAIEHGLWVHRFRGRNPADTMWSLERAGLVRADSVAPTKWYPT